MSTKPGTPTSERAAPEPITRPSRALPVAGVLAILLLIAGFLGLDRWFYEQVSLRLDTTRQRPLGLDFYRATKPLWLTFRLLFGYGLAALAVLVLGLWLERARWRAFVAAAIIAAVTGLAANLVQGAVGRLRPNQAESHLAFAPSFSQLFTKEGVSFPSGEAATAFACAVVLAGLWPRWAGVCVACAACGAVARLVNGAHYLSDVTGGALFGLLVAGGLWRAYAGRSGATSSSMRTAVP